MSPSDPSAPRHKLVTADEAQKILDTCDLAARIVQAGGTTAVLGEPTPSLLDAVPDLAHTVKAMHADVARLTRERDRAVAKAQQLGRIITNEATTQDVAALIDEARRERDEACAILQGSTVAPTDEEIDAHWRAGGAWLVEHRVIRSADEAKRVAAQCRDVGVPWVALNKRGLPCAWPVVTP